MMEPIGSAEEHDEAMPIRAVKTMPPAWVIDGYLAAVTRRHLPADPVELQILSSALATCGQAE
jgi:hypothetical protein